MPCGVGRIIRSFRATTRSRVVYLDLCEEAVTTASNGFDKAGTLSGVAEGLTDFVNSFVEAVVEIDESVCRPEFFLKFLARYYLPWVLKQHRQDLEGLFLKANSQSVFAQFACAKIEFENAKTESAPKLTVFRHREVNLS